MIRRIAKTVLGWVMGERAYLAFLLLAAAAAGLYAWGAAGRADRDALSAWGDTVCASAGAELQPADGKRGEACRAAIADLARYKRDTTIETARILAEAAKEREAKAARDADRARQFVADQRAAAEAMARANAQIGADNRVAGDWFAALNRLARLTPSPTKD